MTNHEFGAKLLTRMVLPDFAGIGEGRNGLHPGFRFQFLDGMGFRYWSLSCTYSRCIRTLPSAKSNRLGQPINHFNLKCTMAEGSVDTIVSAIYLIMEGPSKNKGLDFAEVVRQFPA